MILSLLSVLLLTAVHLLAGRMHFFDRGPFRAAGAGVAISYVFLAIFPYLAQKQSNFELIERSREVLFLESHAYFLALIGFTLFYGLLTVGKPPEKQDAASPSEGKPGAILYLKILPLVLYCAIIGYVIGEQPVHRRAPVILFALAMAIHTAAVDHKIREKIPSFYDGIARHLLAGATIAGWVLANVTRVSDLVFVLVFSFTFGAIMIVAFVYELPEAMGERRYRFFLAGVIGFSILLLLYEALSGIDLGA